EVSPRRPEVLCVLSHMRARPEIAPYLIAHRMQRWLNIVRCPIMNTRVPTWKARRNYRHLVRRYPEIAARLGYSEALSFPSPLHDLEPTHEFRSGSLNTEVTDPLHSQQSVGWRVSTAHDVQARSVSMFSLGYR